MPDELNVHVFIDTDPPSDLCMGWLGRIPGPFWCAEALWDGPVTLGYGRSPEQAVGDLWTKLAARAEAQPVEAS